MTMRARTFDVTRCTDCCRCLNVPPFCAHCLARCTHHFSSCVHSDSPCNPRANSPPFVRVISDTKFFLTRCHFLPIEPIALKFQGYILESYILLISLLKSVQIFSKRNNHFFNNKKSESPIFSSTTKIVLRIFDLS